MCDLIKCDGCGRSFTTDNGAEMLAAISGPCPSCGGTFRLAPLATTTAATGSPPPPTPRR